MEVGDEHADPRARERAHDHVGREVLARANTLVGLGDLVPTGLVFMGAQIHLSTLGFSIANVIAGAGWI